MTYEVITTTEEAAALAVRAALRTYTVAVQHDGHGHALVTIARDEEVPA